MKLPFDKVYCLHLAEAKDRYENCLKEFKRLGIEDQVEFWWTCKREISNKIGNSIDGLHCQFYDDIEEKNKAVYGNVFNCAFEHYTIIKQAYLRGFEHIMIMEDDISFVDNVAKIENMFNSLPKDYDVIKIHHRGLDCHEDPIKKHFQTDSLFIDKGYFWTSDSTMCYALNRKGMEYYINFMDKNFMPADAPFNINEINGKVKAYYCTEPLIFNRWDKSYIN